MKSLPTPGTKEMGSESHRASQPTKASLRLQRRAMALACPFTTAAVARHFDIDVRAVRAMIKAGVMRPDMKYGGSRWRRMPSIGYAIVGDKPNFEVVRLDKVRSKKVHFSADSPEECKKKLTHVIRNWFNLKHGSEFA